MEYIRIIKTELDTFWYSNKVGKVYKTDLKVNFKDNYTIKLSNGKSFAPYGLVKITDAEIVHPNFIQKLLIGLGLHSVEMYLHNNGIL